MEREQYLRLQLYELEMEWREKIRPIVDELALIEQYWPRPMMVAFDSLPSNLQKVILKRRSAAIDELDQRAGKPEGYTLDRENHHGDGSVRGISNGKG